MRYCFAALIAAFILTVDFVQESSAPLVWAGSLVELDDAPGIYSKEVSETDREGGTTSTISGSPENASQLNAEPAIAETSSEHESFNSVSSGDEPTFSTDRICDAIKNAAEESGIPISFFARLLWQESRFRSEEVSSAGARGIAQFMPQTAAEVGLSDPVDPLQAIPASAKFLRKLHNRFGNLGLAAAAYNAGGSRIEKWLSRRGPLPQETRAYVKIITGNKAEDWTAESKIISVPTDLPRQAPCDGVGGLSKSKHNQVAEVPVKLTSSVSEMLRKAEGDEAEARLLAARIALRRIATARARMPSNLAEAKSKKSKVVHLAARMHNGSKSIKKSVVRLASASGR
jgi:hypothetical protein